jgi:hypothetical protein
MALIETTVSSWKALVTDGQASRGHRSSPQIKSRRSLSSVRKIHFAQGEKSTFLINEYKQVL